MNAENQARFPKNEVLLLIGAFLISFSSIWVKVSNVAPEVSAFYRVFFGGLILFFPCLLFREFKRKSRRLNLQAALCGLFFALDLFSWHYSIKFVGPGLATILANCEVFILAVVGYLLYKEKISVLFAISLLLAFAGLFLLVGVDIAVVDRYILIGVGAGIGTAFCYAAFILTLRDLQGKEENSPLFYYQVILLVTASAILGGYILFTGQTFSFPDQQSLLSLLGLGLFSQAIGWVIIAKNLPGVKASHAGLILLLQPSLSFVWDVLLFNRATGLYGWAGVMIVLMAIYLSTLRVQR